MRFQIEGPFWFSQEYLEIGGLACKLGSMVIAEGTIALNVNWLL